MLVSEVITLAQLQADEVYDDPTWISYINIALDDLTPVIKLLKKKEAINVTITSGKGTLNVMTDADLKKSHEFLHVYDGTAFDMLRRLPLKDNISKGWKLVAGEILFQALTPDGAHSIRVDYYKRLEKVSALSDDVETVSGLPAHYHNLLVLYCAAKSQQKEEELNDKNDFYSEYLLNKRTLALDRIWEMEPQYRKYIKKARIATFIGAQAGS